ncbi:MAG: PQQ-binding-like beta-propeller repeat protein [Phycisphaeraceae bacterium]
MQRTLSIILIALVSSAALAEDRNQPRSYPRWRGADASASVTGGDYPVQLTDAKNLAWKIELPGKGCSSPVVWGDAIVITCPVEEQDALMSFNFEGKHQWTAAIGKARGGKHRNGSAANPSPATDGTRIFAYFKSGNLAAVDFKGKLLWETNLQERFGKDTLYWDLGTSPVLTKKHVIIAVMHAGDSYLAAFDQATGDLAWKADRNYECPTEGDQSYATPIVIDHKGKEAILVWGAERLTAHDTTDGKVIWSCEGFNPKKQRNWVVVASHTIVDDMVIVPYGRGSHITGVKLGGEGDVTKTHRLWTRDDSSAFVPTPAGHDGKVYIVGDRGKVTCLDAKTGDVKWSGDLPKSSSSYYSSPMIAGGKLYATREDGVIFVTSLDGKLTVLSENDMGERIIATPVPVANRLLLRGEKHLFCIVERKATSE